MSLKRKTATTNGLLALVLNRIKQKVMDNSLENRIIRQVEFYFGDSNIVRDKFLLEEIQNNNEGWVSVETLVGFKRLASILNANQVEEWNHRFVVAEALRTSGSDLIEVSEDRTKIKRVKPIPEITHEIKRDIALRTVYCKNLNKSAKLGGLLEFFQNFGDVEKITMRYYGLKKNPHFKGSALVEFKTKEEAETFLKKENVKHEDVSLFRQRYDDWSAEKRESLSKKEAKKKEKLDRKEKNKKNLIKELTEATEPGSIILITDLHKSVCWNDIKTEFKAFIDPSEIFVDTINKDGKVAGYVRLTNAEKAKEVKEKIGDIIEIALCEGKVKILEGDAEKEYLETVVEKRMKEKSKKGEKPGQKMLFRGVGQKGGRPSKRQRV